MTTPSTGDAMGESLPDEVVEAVADEMAEDVLAQVVGEGREVIDFSRLSRIAIKAYRRASDVR